MQKAAMAPINQATGKGGYANGKTIFPVWTGSLFNLPFIRGRA